MQQINRRRFVSQLASASVALGGAAILPRGLGAADAGRKMTLCLACGSIGVSANQVEAITLAHRHGFESVEASGEYLAGLSAGQLAELQADMKEKQVVFGAAGLSVEFRQDDGRFADGMSKLPQVADGLRRAGVDRVGTWLMPCHPSLTFLQNFKQHAKRLREVAMVLKDRGQRLGMEYVGTPTVRNSQKYPFIHTLAEMRDLMGEIGTGNTGVVLDTWHWWTAGDTEADLLGLKNKDVISVDLNDAPSGVPLEQQVDGRRELPAATGVIDVATFLTALNKIGYDGPVRAEPFNKPLNDMGNEEACAATIEAMKKAFALLRPA